MELKTGLVAGLTIYTADQLDGHGLMHISDAVSTFKFFVGDRRFKKALEWCSGPGYLGLMLYRYDIADSVVLSDIFEPLANVVNKTIKENCLENSIRFIHSDNFKSIDEKFDLIIGNPPHFNYDLKITEETVHYNEHRKFIDRHWKIHEDFFNNVSHYLDDDGCIILMENVKGSTPETFREMIKNNNLKIKNVLPSCQYPQDVWYCQIVKDLK